MKLWLLKIVGQVGYNEYDEFLVRAITENEARKLANEKDFDSTKNWEKSQFATCEEITIDGASGVIISSFNAG